MYNIYFTYFKHCLLGKLLRKTVWVLNNFLTMACYRKLCNRLYWKKIQPGTTSYTTRCWFIFLSVISAVWLAFFYDPTDPANLNSPSRLLSLFSKIFRKIDHSLCKLINALETAVSARQYEYVRSYRTITPGNVMFWRTQETYLKTSSLLI